MKSRNGLGAAAALGLMFAAIAPRGVGALTLADLDGGGSFSAGSLTFDDFDVVIAGDLSADLTDYAVQVLADGFRISGPRMQSLDLSFEAPRLRGHQPDRRAAREGAAQ